MTIIVALAPGTAAHAGESPSSEEAPYFAKERGISVAEAQQRLEWQAAAPDLAERLEKELGTRFGGVWIDEHAGDRVKVGVARQLDSASLAIIKSAAADTGLGQAVDPVAVPRSMPELGNAMSWLRPQLTRVNAGATVTLAAGIRTDLNSVQLSLPRSGALSDAQIELVQSAKRYFGQSLAIGSHGGNFAPFTCDVPYCDAPLRGSVKINGPGTWCSSAFVARSKVDSKLYLMTAGHCGDNLGTWSTKYADLSVHTIGPVHHWQFHSTADFAIIRIEDAAAWQPQPWVNVTFGPMTMPNPTYHIASDKLSIVGIRVCTTGAATKVSNCGRVTELDFSATYANLTVHHQGRSSLCARPGDSGAPIFASHVAYGILTGGYEGECDTIYQGVRAAENALNVNVLH